MHKSIICLLGLLTFLLPFGPSSMSNSNVMAFEEDGYETDHYDQYATDMANGNYYKSQKSSDLIKKIKCNNINSNLNGIEANIGTGDSLGLGAESIEADDASANWFGNGERNNNGKDFRFFCINNNDNENNIVNETTPIPPEPTQLTIGTNIYLVQDTDSGDGVVLNGLAICDPGDFVLNGGYILSGTLSDSTIVGRNTPLVFDVPSVASPGQAWVVTASGLDSGTNHNLLTNAYCFDNPPAHIP